LFQNSEVPRIITILLRK